MADAYGLERAIGRLVGPLVRRVLGMLLRATLVMAEDRRPVQAAQVDIGSAEHPDIVDRAELLQQFGFASVALPGARCLLISIGGDRGHAVVILPDDRKRQPGKLLPGESMMFNAAGLFAHLRADGTYHVKAPKIVLEADDLVLLAKNRYRLDVHGKAEETRHVEGSNYETEAWNIGAVVTAADPNPLAPPHSEAPPAPHGE